jgi:hypothetical protein
VVKKTKTEWGKEFPENLFGYILSYRLGFWEKLYKNPS